MTNNNDVKKDYSKIGALATVVGVLIAIVALLFGDGLLRENQNEGVVVGEIADVSLSENSMEINKGEIIELTATIFPSDAANAVISWSSSDISVVTVNDEGVITAVGGGNAIIEASCGGKRDTCAVKVNVRLRQYQKWVH